MGLGAGFASAFLGHAVLGQAFTVGGITFKAGTSLAIGGGIAFSSGTVGGMVGETITQAFNGGINDVKSIFTSGLQCGIINTVSAFSGSIGVKFTAGDSILLSALFGSTTSSVGMLIDVLRNRSARNPNGVRAN